MRSPRTLARAFVLALLASLSLVATVTSAAQAGEFRILKIKFTSLGVAAEEFLGAIAAGKLLVPGLGITISCAGGVLTGTALLGGTVHARALFNGCFVEGNKFCKLYETKLKKEMNEGAGNIEALGLGELLLHNGEHYVKFESTLAEALATIFMTRSSLGCALPLEELVTGAVVFKLPKALEELLLQPTETVPQATLEKLFPNFILRYGNQIAWLDGGAASAHLAGIFKDDLWGME